MVWNNDAPIITEQDRLEKLAQTKAELKAAEEKAATEGRASRYRLMPPRRKPFTAQPTGRKNWQAWGAEPMEDL